VVINLFQFFRHYKSPFYSVIRIHLISLSYHILVILPPHFSSMEQMLMLMLEDQEWILEEFHREFGIQNTDDLDFLIWT